MRFYHLTDGPHSESICRTGFQPSGSGGAQETVWLCCTRQGAIELASRAEGWFVVVEIPEDDAEPFAQFDDGRPYFDSYLVPIQQVNAHLPFERELWR